MNIRLHIAALILCAALSGARQEAPFRHKPHAPLRLKCVSCHATAEKDEPASFPALSQCRTCHTAIAGLAIPSRRVFTIPGFVFFSHASHAAAKVECQSCHGDVWSESGPRQAKPMKMAECVDCHKERKASLVCNSCHELGQ